MPNCNNCYAKITKKNPSKNGFCNKCAEHEISLSPDFNFSSSKSSRSRSKSRSKSKSRSRRSTPKISPVSPNSKKKGGSKKTRRRRRSRTRK